MEEYEKEIISLFAVEGKELKASFYQSNHVETKAIILYFHGGGLVFGQRDDLPKQYIDLFTKNGLAILAVDYPLAPQAKLPLILETSFKITDYFVHQFLTQKGTDHYFIMGRSAGAYLSLSAGLHARKFENKALGILSLYGYYSLASAEFSSPSSYYLNYPKVKEGTISHLITKEEILSEGKQDRFLLYLFGRQRGNWMDFLLSSPEEKSEFSLNKEQIKTLAPLFLAAAKKDPDVPSRQSRQLANFHPSAELVLYDSDEHDFDRTQQQTFGIDLYEKMLAWILEKIE